MVINNWSRYIQFYGPIIINEVYNSLKFGRRFKSHQKIFINPSSVNTSTRFFQFGEAKYLLDGSDINDDQFFHKRQKFIVGGDWDKLTTKIENFGPYFRYMQRLSYGYSWEEIGEIKWINKRIKQFGIQDNCRTFDDIYKRLQKIDEIFKSVKSMGRLKEMREIRRLGFREKGGIGIGIGRKGELIFIADGAHRLAMAKFLGFKKIPATLLIVHKDFIRLSNFKDFL